MTRREPLVRLLREASDAALPGGAAERIADRAWARATEIRSAPPAARAVALPRIAWTGAAAAAVGGLLLLLPVGGPAFAVDGDPVQVLREDRWSPARSVPLDRWVWVPAGARSVRTDDGSTIAPQPGAVFRIVRSQGVRPAWRVEMRSGDAEVSGSSLVLAVADRMEVVDARPPATADAGPSHGLRVRVSFSASAHGAPGPRGTASLPPAEADAVVRVLSGEARVAGAAGDDLLLVRPSQAVTTIDIDRDGRTERRLAMECGWSDDIAASLLRGSLVMGAGRGPGGDVSLALRTPGSRFLAVRVPREAAAATIEQVNLLTLHAAEARTRTDARPADAGTGTVAASRGASPHVVAEFVHERDGKRTAIRVRDDGSATLERGGAAEEYPDLASLRRAAPDAAGLFGDRLPATWPAPGSGR